LLLSKTFDDNTNDAQQQLVGEVYLTLNHSFGEAAEGGKRYGRAG